jgi:DNA topoisomerase-1
VALRLVVEREEERRAFTRATYWDITAGLEADGIRFEATLTHLGGRRIASGKDFDDETGQLKTPDAVLLGEAEAQRVAEGLQQRPWSVSQVEQKETRQRPQPPFITSTLQQAASSLLGMSPKQTMQVAQRLYEGVDLGQGEREGVITYMRTDSVVLSERALGEAAAYIRRHFGEQYHRRMQYTTKSKMAQEAHEAIRPTHISRTPKELAPFLKDDELKLYRLIWNRTVASQMAEAQLLKTTVDFTADAGGQAAVLRANGSVVVFPGFLKVADTAQEDAKLPPLQEGDSAAMADAGGSAHRVQIVSIVPERHETKPPARYTEASLVRRLEEEGIGRPSTYASTVSTIEDRGYVVRRGKALVPTYLGIAVTHLLRKHFGEYVDLKFTARMEDTLDRIAEGEQSWLDFLRMFYFGSGDFGQGLEARIAAELEKIEYPAIPVGEAQGQAIVVRVGRNGAYLQRGEGGKGNTANLSEQVPYDELTPEKALAMLEQRAQGAEPLGVDPATGMNVYVFNGQYGPYVQLGEQEEGSKKKPKRVSLLQGVAPESVDLQTALNYLALPRTLGMHPEKGKPVQAGLGRFGPYVVCDGEFRSLRNADSVFSIDLPRALELLAQPKGARRGKALLRELGRHPESGLAIELFDGRYGPYVSDGSVNATLPKGTSPEAVTLEQAVQLLAEAATRPRRAKKSAAKRASAAKAPAKKKAAAKRKSA